jgi:hypothetical protein
MPTVEAISYYHRNLPHFRKEFAVCFVTFRLVESIPKDVLCRRRDDRRSPGKRKPHAPLLMLTATLANARRGASWLLDAEVTATVGCITSVISSHISEKNQAQDP